MTVDLIIESCIDNPLMDAKNIASLIYSFIPSKKNYEWRFQYRTGSHTGGCFTVDCTFVAASLEECEEMFMQRDYHSYYYYLDTELFAMYCKKVLEAEVAGSSDIKNFCVTCF